MSMESFIVFEYEKAKFWTKEGVLFCEFNNRDIHHRLTSGQVERYIEIIKELTNGQIMPFLIDIRNSFGNFTIKAAELFANSPYLKSIRLSEAYVINSINSKLSISSYKRLFEPKTPFQFFDNLDSALEYCLQSKDNYYGTRF